MQNISKHMIWAVVYCMIILLHKKNEEKMTCLKEKGQTCRKIKEEGSAKYKAMHRACSNYNNYNN